MQMTEYAGLPVGDKLGAIGNTNRALRPGKPEQRIRLSPQSELQELLAEDSIEDFLDYSRLLRQQCLAKGRSQPLVNGLAGLIPAHDIFCHKNYL